MTELLGVDGRPLRIHRIRLEVSLINGAHHPLPRPVPCEVCGAPVYLLDVEHWCEPGRRRRKVTELARVGWQYVLHDCASYPAADPPIVPRCEVCEDAMLAWCDGKVAEADRLLEESRQRRAEAERHHAEAQRHLARALEILRGSA